MVLDPAAWLAVLLAPRLAVCPLTLRHRTWLSAFGRLDLVPWELFFGPQPRKEPTMSYVDTPLLPTWQKVGCSSCPAKTCGDDIRKRTRRRSERHMIRSKRRWGHLECNLFLPPSLLELHAPATPGLRLPGAMGERLKLRAPGRPSLSWFCYLPPLGQITQCLQASVCKVGMVLAPVSGGCPGY